jgi:beta-galactosidase
MRKAAMGALSVAATPILTSRSSGAQTGIGAIGPAARIMPLDQGWLFGGVLDQRALEPDFDDTSFSRINIPHCATPLSWQDWKWENWQQVWCYRRYFQRPAALGGLRWFLEFDGVMVGAEPVLNGNRFPKHLGGYLPFQHEITDAIRDGENVLAVAVDSRWSNVPPQGSPKGPPRVDYLEAGGIHRSVRLRAVPSVFISDVFVKASQVLEPSRTADIVCTIDAATVPEGPIRLYAEVGDGIRVLSRSEQAIRIEKPGTTAATLRISGLEKIKLWDVDAPNLYSVVTTLTIGGKPVHDYQVRTGFREARFERDGFYLNGRRLQIFGLNRHEIYPYAGFAMPSRVKRRDAHILKREFNCNFVRCSHYPQSPAFLDACDELGLLVWQEVPGWGYLGDDAWKELLVRDAHDMIMRDRNRPSIVIWGTRANESANDEELYRRTRAEARALDGTRPTSGSMTSGSRKTWETEWHEDVFAFDDYHTAQDGSVGIDGPAGERPYMLAEAVGQFNYVRRKGFDSYYRRGTDAETQKLQALRHAQAHNKAGANRRICGVVAWCGFEYSSPVNSYRMVKYPGVADVFRIPKLGASFYMAQCDPRTRPVIEPDFYWDFGPQTPRGPGLNAAIFSNCERLELFVAGKHHSTLRPDTFRFSHLKHPPFFADLDMDGVGHPELRIDGFLGVRHIFSRSFSSDSALDKLFVAADDEELIGDGSDATRLVFKVVDKFDANRAFGKGEVQFEITGPGSLLGDNPFDLGESGGAGAIWIRALPRKSGIVHVKARHSHLGSKSVRIRVKSDSRIKMT